ncbi:MAG: molecular chaperone TorD family protein [Helicobacteraceae bacterium]|jgi:TorA maturation chaperone TorD|nr:molecular chaperone TorD family protein [Helicobacteraceae bacterium]
MYELNAARSVLYGALSLLFVYGAAHKKPEDTITALKAIEDSDFDKEACQNVKLLREALEKEGGFDALGEEFSALFLIPFGEIVPMNASRYYDEQEAGKPLAIVREILKNRALIKDSQKFSENEDNLGFIFALMSRLNRQSAQGEEQSAIAAQKLYKEIINPFAPNFVARLKKNPNIALYGFAVNLLDRFLLFEAEFYS